ncbi:hypothetical protein FRC12_001096 [Ceratobasidium sp. 428]|nr:hypothetical protein FRC12_001096 [Ceratobasidium sp. 428]
MSAYEGLEVYSSVPSIFMSLASSPSSTWTPLPATSLLSHARPSAVMPSPISVATRASSRWVQIGISSFSHHSSIPNPFDLSALMPNPGSGSPLKIPRAKSSPSHAAASSNLEQMVGHVQCESASTTELGEHRDLHPVRGSDVARARKVTVEELNVSAQFGDAIELGERDGLLFAAEAEYEPTLVAEVKLVRPGQRDVEHGHAVRLDVAGKSPREQVVLDVDASDVNPEISLTSAVIQEPVAGAGVSDQGVDA